jgi:Glycosyl transferases group 1
MAFDHAFVFHPGFETLFAEAGLPSTTLLPHAVDPSLCSSKEQDQRMYDLGWVGHYHGPLYQRRRRLLPKLSEQFTMNRWQEDYSETEVFSIYGQCKIVMNVGRDDWPQDANLRVFEAMSSGALLVTSLPSELVKLGFVPGRHFMGYTDEREIVPLLHDLLLDESKRVSIAGAAREFVLREHTYDRRVETIIGVVRQARNEQSRAPWRAKQSYEGVQLDYCIGHRAWRESLILGLSLAIRHPLVTARVLFAVLQSRFIRGRLVRTLREETSIWRLR